MKKLFLVVSLLICFSCSVKKKVIEKSSKTEKIEVLEDFQRNSLVTKSEPINESYFIGVKTNNNVIDSVINTKFLNFHTYKKSGKNFISAKYDSVQQGIVITTKIGASVDSLLIEKSNNVVKTDLSISKKKETEKKRNNKWLIYMFLIIIVLFVLAGFYFKNKLKLL